MTLSRREFLSSSLSATAAAAQQAKPGSGQGKQIFTEDCRVSIPLAKSLKRFVGEKDFWPQGFTGVVKKHG